MQGAGFFATYVFQLICGVIFRVPLPESFNQLFISTKLGCALSAVQLWMHTDKLSNRFSNKPNLVFNCMRVIAICSLQYNTWLGIYLCIWRDWFTWLSAVYIALYHKNIYSHNGGISLHLFVSTVSTLSARLLVIAFTTTLNSYAPIISSGIYQSFPCLHNTVIILVDSITF